MFTEKVRKRCRNIGFRVPWKSRDEIKKVVVYNLNWLTKKNRNLLPGYSHPCLSFICSHHICSTRFHNSVCLRLPRGRVLTRYTHARCQNMSCSKKSGLGKASPELSMGDMSQIGRAVWHYVCSPDLAPETTWGCWQRKKPNEFELFETRNERQNLSRVQQTAKKTAVENFDFETPVRAQFVIPSLIVCQNPTINMQICRLRSELWGLPAVEGCVELMHIYFLYLHPSFSTFLSISPSSAPSSHIERSHTALLHSLLMPAFASVPPHLIFHPPTTSSRVSPAASFSAPICLRWWNEASTLSPKTGASTKKLFIFS